MENFGRREFIIRGLLFAAPSLFLPEVSLGRRLPRRYNKKWIHFTLPDISLQTHHRRGKLKGGRILLIGGIHGNEPGAYKTASILSQVELRRGELITVPRSNFLSILANVRGYNGDMNRKFAGLSKRDPDYRYVEALKQLIRETKPDVVLSLHDGFGFHVLNRRFWGECIVIDSKYYNGYNLWKVASCVSSQVNRRISNPRWKIPVFNTDTFARNTKHPEQRKSLTYFCLKECKVPAFCLEVSKQLPDLSKKVSIHLKMLREFFRIFGVETEPDIDTIISEMASARDEGSIYSVHMSINGRNLVLTSGRTIAVPSRSEITVHSVNGEGGVNVIPSSVNLNWRRFRIRRNAVLKVKNDFREIFRIKFLIT